MRVQPDGRRMTRREFVGRTAALGISAQPLGSLLAASAAPAAPAAGAKKVLRCGMLWNQTMVGYKALLKMVEVVKDKSGGSLEMQLFPGEQLGPAPEEVESVKIGGQDMFAEVVEWFGPLVKDYNIFGAAFAFRDVDHVVKFATGPMGQEIAEQLRTQHGIRVLDQSAPEPARQLMTRKPVKSAADVQGLKMRVPQIPAYFAVWKAIGANPTPIPWADIYTALQGGVVDAMEGTMADIFSSRFGEVIKNMAITDHLVSTNFVIINDKVYQSLTPKQQDALNAGAKEFATTHKATMTEFLKTAKDGLASLGVRFNEKPDRASFKDKAKSAILDLEKQGKWSAGLYDKIQAIK